MRKFIHPCRAVSWKLTSRPFPLQGSYLLGPDQWDGRLSSSAFTRKQKWPTRPWAGE